MTDFFASDDWQPADWLQALDRLAPAPAVEASSMKPKKPCANCGIVPAVNQAFGRDWWIECKNPHCKNQAHQMTYYPTPEQAVTAWDAPRWYESQPADEIPASSKMLDAVTDAPERMIEYLLFQPDIVPSCTCSGDCENTLVFMINYQHYHVDISTIGMLNVEYYTLAGQDLCRLVRDECLPLVRRLSYMSLHHTRLNTHGYMVVFMLAVEVKDDPQHQGRFVIEVLGLLEQRGADLIVVPPPSVLELSI